MNGELALRIVGQNSRGVIVRGARVLATLGPFADEMFVYPGQPMPKDADPAYAIAFSIPMASRGLITICRDHYGTSGARVDHPFSSRFDEQDAFVIFDDVEVPFERLFIDARHRGLQQDHEQRLDRQRHAADVDPRRGQARVRLRAGDAHGQGAERRGPQRSAADARRDLVLLVATRAAMRAAEADARDYGAGTWFCDERPFRAIRSLMPGWMARTNEIIKLLGAHNLLATPEAAAFDDARCSAPSSRSTCPARAACRPRIARSCSAPRGTSSAPRSAAATSCTNASIWRAQRARSASTTSSRSASASGTRCPSSSHGAGHDRDACRSKASRSTAATSSAASASRGRTHVRGVLADRRQACSVRSQPAAQAEVDRAVRCCARGVPGVGRARRRRRRGEILDRFAQGILDRKNDLSAVETADNGSLLIANQKRIVDRAAHNIAFFSQARAHARARADPRPRRRQPRALRASRRRRADHAVERAADALDVEDRSRARGRQHRRDQAAGVGAAVVLVARGHREPRPACRAGVLNVVQGLGPEAGQALVSHPGVDRVSFTGSIATGRRVAADAPAPNVTPVSLELGGKSPFIVFADADLDDAASTVAAQFGNAGQVCLAGTRVLVDAAIEADFRARVLKEAAAFGVGDPRTKGVRVGPLIHPRQLERVERLRRARARRGRARIDRRRTACERRLD